MCAALVVPAHLRQGQYPNGVTGMGQARMQLRFVVLNQARRAQGHEYPVEDVNTQLNLLPEKKNKNKPATQLLNELVF